MGTRPNVWKTKATERPPDVHQRVLAQRGELVPVDDDPAARGPVQAAEQVEERRLAAARPAAHGQQLAPRDATGPRPAARGPRRRRTGSRGTSAVACDHRTSRAIGRGASAARTARSRVVVPGRRGSAGRPSPSGHTPTWSRSEAQTDAMAQGQRLDVGPRQLEPAGPVQDGELLGDHPVIARVARSVRRTVSLLVRPSRMATVRATCSARAGRGSR